MENDSQIWETWVAILDRWGLKKLAATFLDALGPLNLLGAQVVYVGQPLLNTFLPENQLSALASLLENSQATQAFVSSLREDDRADV